MDLKDQVCTEEQAKILWRLHIKQSSIFSWVHKGPYNCGEDHYEASASFITEGSSQSLDFPYHFDGSAFTVAELGIMLAHGTGMCSYHHEKWKAEYEHETIIPECKNKGTGTTHYLVHQKTEAQARAAFLIYSIESGFLTAEECNKRLSA